MKRKTIFYLLILGIVAAIIYPTYAIVGNLMWEEYNPITTDISSLGADGAPNQNILNPIIYAYHACMLVFLISYIVYVYKTDKRKVIKIGAILLLIMQIISSVGYKLFPLDGQKTVMSFQNTMHIVVTVCVVFTSIAALFLISIGYIKDGMKFGKAMLVFAILFTIFGLSNPIGMANNLDILGLTERMTIHTLHIAISLLSIYSVKESKGMIK